LEARQIDASRDRLISEALGEIEVEDNVLVIRHIHVRMRLKAEECHWEAANRVHGFFADKCPVFRSLRAAISMTTELVLEPLLALSPTVPSRGSRDRRLEVS
jgi:uncharacterized OsmC-like protein